MKPITALGLLPEHCRDEYWQALTGALDEQFTLMQATFDPDQFRRDVLDPLTAKPEFLDYRAEMSLLREKWVPSWPERAKREMLANQLWLVQNRYAPMVTLPRLFDWFALDAEVRPSGGFTLGSQGPNDGLLGPNSEGTGATLRSYKVIVPPSYTKGTIQRHWIDQLIELLGLPFEIPIEIRS